MLLVPRWHYHSGSVRFYFGSDIDRRFRFDQAYIKTRNFGIAFKQMHEDLHCNMKVERRVRQVVGKAVRKGQTQNGVDGLQFALGIRTLCLKKFKCNLYCTVKLVS
jgi:hypothetical protein